MKYYYIIYDTIYLCTFTAFSRYMTYSNSYFIIIAQYMTRFITTQYDIIRQYMAQYIFALYIKHIVLNDCI